MTVATYPLGKPPAPAMRGGDCRARDLTQARNVHGPHVFAATTDCQISNGLVQITVGATGAVPALSIMLWHGAGTGTVTGDIYSDTYADLYAGVTSPPTAGWVASGTLTIDSPDVVAPLTAVRIVRMNHRFVTIRLVAPFMADAFVTLRQGWRSVTIQHGSKRPPFLTMTRRISWTASGMTGQASRGRVVETAPLLDGYARFVAGVEAGATTDAAAFSMTSPSIRSFLFGAGAGTSNTLDTPADQHAQLYDASRLELVLT